MKTGLPESEFWEMTLSEIQRWALAVSHRKSEELKLKAQMDYTLAATIGQFVACMFSSGSRPPEIEDVYPSLFDRQDKSVQNFLNFATQYNAKYEKEEGGDSQNG